MAFSSWRPALLLLLFSTCSSVGAFSSYSIQRHVHALSTNKIPSARRRSCRLYECSADDNSKVAADPGVMNGIYSVWEELAKSFVTKDFATRPAEMKKYVQCVTLLRVGVPAVAAASASCLAYPSISLTLAAIINDPDVFAVIAQDSSQYIQNILTTCGLMFSILMGYTYYFLYQQQESIYYALFEEVTVAKSLLEQVSLVGQGRTSMYTTLLDCIDRYVREDLMQFAVEPSVMLSSRPIDDPLEDIMYMTSVGEPSIVYQTVRSLRQARAQRLGALQRKLPPIHMVLLWTLACIVLCTFPLLGAGVQTIGGLGILAVQSWYLGFMVFGINVVMGVIRELSDPAGKGAYNVVSVLAIMVAGLEEELEGRLSDKYSVGKLSPTVDVTIPWESEVEVSTDNAELEENSPVVSSSGSWFGTRIAKRIGRRKM